MGRPLKEINWEIVDKYLEAGTRNGAALARKFRIQSDTFYRRFKEEYGCAFQDYNVDSQGIGVEDIRLMIHAKALNNKAPGNATMLMFLGRCLLGMKEPEVSQLVAPKQDDIDKDHQIMILKHEIAELKDNGNKRETGQELCRSYPSI